MKKIILAIALFAAVSANAQNDGFFNSNYSEYRDRTEEWGQTMPGLPGQHGVIYDFSAEPSAPLGSGLLLLGGMAVLYARRKKMN